MRKYSTHIIRESQVGFTMIEVMVALVVLSIGLLGIAKLMLFASQSNDSAYLRSQATELAYQMLDTMRANRAAAIAGNYDTAIGTAAAPAASCLATQCSAQNLAAYDVYAWKQRLSVASTPVAGLLPGGTGSITTNTPSTSPTMTTATIIVQWDDAVAQSTFNASAASAPIGTPAPMQITLETIL
jgi:type IV pilus assembly protein PilV